MRYAINVEHAERYLSVVLDPSYCQEMRVVRANMDAGGMIIKPLKYKRTVSGYFNSKDSFIKYLKRTSKISIYTTFNPLDPRLLGRLHNKCEVCDATTKDENVKIIRWAYIDIDHERIPDVSSTNEELLKCIELRDRLLSEQPSVRDNAIWGCSGNGAWVLVRLNDLPNCPE